MVAEHQFAHTKLVTESLGLAEQVERLHCSITTPPPTGVVGLSGGAGRGNGLSKTQVEQPAAAVRFPAGNPVLRPLDEDDPAADFYDASRTRF